MALPSNSKLVVPIYKVVQAADAQCELFDANRLFTAQVHNRLECPQRCHSVTLVKCRLVPLSDPEQPVCYDPIDTSFKSGD